MAALPEVIVEDVTDRGADAADRPTLVRPAGGGGRGLLVLVAVTAVVLVAALASTGSQHAATAPTTTAVVAPSTTTPDSGPPVPAVSGRLVVWRGDQVISLPADGTGSATLIATIRPSGSRAQLWVEQDWAWAIGSRESGDTRTGGWMFPLDGSWPGVYLGPADALLANEDGVVWLTETGSIRVALPVEAAPTTVARPDRVVAASHDALVVQRVGEVVWSNTAPAPAEITIGRGYGLAARYATVLWSTDVGQLVLTHPTSRWTYEPPTPPAVWRYGSLSPFSRSYVAVSGQHVAFGSVGGPGFDVFLDDPVVSVAWATDTVLVAAGRDGSITYLDATTGGRRRGPPVQPGVNAIGFLPV